MEGQNDHVAIVATIVLVVPPRAGLQPQYQVGILSNRCLSSSVCIQGWALLQYTSIVGLKVGRVIEPTSQNNRQARQRVTLSDDSRTAVWAKTSMNGLDQSHQCLHRFSAHPGR